MEVWCGAGGLGWNTYNTTRETIYRAAEKKGENEDTGERFSEVGQGSGGG